jgi:hypothetical protein
MLSVQCVGSNLGSGGCDTMCYVRQSKRLKLGEIYTCKMQKLKIRTNKHMLTTEEALLISIPPELRGHLLHLH